MSDAALRFYEGIAGRYDRVYAACGSEARARLAEVVALLPARSRVLVLGVGTGRELSALLDAGHAPTGMDFSPRMLERARRRGQPVPLVLGDFWQPLPFLPGAFDACVALHGTLSHAAEPAQIAALACELGRVLRPGGVLVLEAPSPAWAADLPASSGASTDDEDADGRSTRRLADGRVLTHDHAAHVSVECLTLDACTWARLLGPHFLPRASDDGYELRVVGVARA